MSSYQNSTLADTSILILDLSWWLLYFQTAGNANVMLESVYRVIPDLALEWNMWQVHKEGENVFNSRCFLFQSTKVVIHKFVFLKTLPLYCTA